MKAQSLREKLAEWNNKYPYDLAWRYNNDIKFGSEEHKSMDFISMLFSLIQEKEIHEFLNKEEEVLDEDGKQLFESKDIVKMSKEEINEEFDNLDLTAFNDIG